MPRSRGRKGDSRGKHRLRREIGIGRRTAKALAAQWQKTFTVLLTVLAQQGGEVTVTKGTMDQVAGELMGLTYAVEKGKIENEYVVRVITKVVGPVVATTVPETPTLSEAPAPPERTYLDPPLYEYPKGDSTL